MYHFLNTDSPIFPVSEEKLQSLEEHLGYSFPASLRSFYKEFNGCRSIETTFHSFGRDFTVTSVMPLFEYSMSAVRSKELLAHSSKLPVSFFPFAVNDDADDYFIDLATGKIYLVPTDSLNRHLLAADTIDDFFTLMEQGIRQPEPVSEITETVLDDPWSAAKKNPMSEKKKNPPFFHCLKKRKTAEGTFPYSNISVRSLIQPSR